MAVAAVRKDLKILSFNVQNFSETKFRNQPVLDIILQIIENYDLILLLEMEDHHIVLIGLVDQLNERHRRMVGGNDRPVHHQPPGEVFAGLRNGPLGERGRPEEYAFIYRQDRVEILDYYQSTSERIVRSPFPIHVKAIGMRLNFFIVPIHATPRRAQDVTINELDALPRIFYDAKRRFDATYGLIMGDLNCGGTYVSRRRYEELSLYTKDDFVFLINYDQDTTTGHHRHAYDRIVRNPEFARRVVEGSVQVVRFDEDLGLTPEQTQAVSDHYPVTITLR